MSHYPPPATHAGWVAAIEAGQYAVFDMVPGHHMLVATPDRIQARCSCGWNGPDRTHTPPAALLAVDDVDWHMSHTAEEARALAATLATGPGTRLWWER